MTTPTTAGGAVLPAFESPAVQTVYEVLCDGAIPPDNEHWEGFVACRIVAALTTHAPAQATIDSLSAEVERLTRERDDLRIEIVAGDKVIDELHDELAALRAAQDDQARDAALRMARAHIVWLAFGECRSPGWDGAPPSALEAVAAIDAAIDATKEAP